MLTALALPANAKTGHFVLNFDCTNVPSDQVYTIYNYKKNEAYMGGMTYGLTTTGSMPTYITGGFEGVQFGNSQYQLNFDGIYFSVPFAGMTNVTLTMKGNYDGGTFWTGYTTDGGDSFTRLYYSVDAQHPGNDPDKLTPVAGTLNNYTFRTVGFKPVNGNLMFKMNSTVKGFYLRVQKIDVTCDVAEIPDLLYTAVTSTSPIDYAASGLTAYGVIVKDGKAVLTPVTGLVAANSVVLVKGLQAATYPLVTTNSTKDTGTAVTSEVKISDGTVTGDGKTVFALGKDANGIIGFNLVDNGTEVPDGTGYVTVTDATTSTIPLVGQSLAVSAEGYGTLYDGTNNLSVPAGATAYTYTVANNQLRISKTYEEGSVIPKGTGVVIKAAEGNCDLPVSAEPGEADKANMLKGTDTEATTTGDGLFYMLSLNASGDPGSIGFYWGAENGAAFTCAAHKAYLVAPATATAAKGWSLESATTGISHLTTGATNKADHIYNLSGQRVDSNYRGIVIRGGKKYVNR